MSTLKCFFCGLAERMQDAEEPVERANEITWTAEKVVQSPSGLSRMLTKPQTLSTTWTEVRALFLGLALVGAVTSPGSLESGDSSLRFETARSWLDGRGGALPPGIPGAPGKDGRTYNYYGLTQSLIFVSVLAPLRAVGVPRAELLTKFIYSVVFLPIVFGALGVVLVVFLRRIGVKRGPIRAVLCLLLCTPLLTYARVGQEENLLALAYAVMLLGLVLTAQEAGSGWVILGAGAAFAVATRLASLPSVLIIIVAAIPALRNDLRAGRHRGLIVAAAMLMLGAILAYGYWNWRRFGSPLESGYRFGFARLGVPIFDFPGWPAHTAALLFSPRRGILLYAPILVALPFAARGWASEEPLIKRMILFGAVAWVVNLLFFSLSGTWDGGFGWGPRYLVAPLVFLAPLFARLPWSNRTLRALLVISASAQASSVVLPTSTEDFIGAIQQARGGRCDAWTLDCSGIWLRPRLALGAIRTTLSARELPTLDEGQPAAAADVLPTSDYRAVYWWPVRAAYRLHVGSPRMALGASILAILGGLWLLARSMRAEDELDSAGIRPARTAPG